MLCALFTVIYRTDTGSGPVTDSGLEHGERPAVATHHSAIDGVTGNVADIPGEPGNGCASGWCEVIRMVIGSSRDSARRAVYNKLLSFGNSFCPARLRPFAVAEGWLKKRPFPQVRILSIPMLSLLPAMSADSGSIFHASPGRRSGTSHDKRVGARSNLLVRPL